MFALRCSRVVAPKAAMPSTFYFNRAGRMFSSSAARSYETVTPSNPTPNVGMSM